MRIAYRQRTLKMSHLFCHIIVNKNKNIYDNSYANIKRSYLSCHIIVNNSSRTKNTKANNK